MAIKAGQYLFDSRGFVIDRIQTGGPSGLQIPKEKIYEVGNFSSVSTLFDIPQLTFSAQSFDVSTELEALTLGYDPAAVIAGPSGTQLDFRNFIPMDVISPFRSRQNQYDIVGGVVTPYLSLESVQYRFGVHANSEQTFQYRGDTINFVPGSPYQQRFTITSGTNQAYTLAQTALAYTEGGTTFHVLSACVKNISTGAFQRLFITSDYTDTTTTITTLANWYAAGYQYLDVTYGSATAATYSTSVNTASTVKPGAVRGKDVCVYVSDGAATPTLTRWDGIQTVDVQMRLNLTNLEELCNQKYVGIDFNTTDCTGTITTQPSSATNLQNKVAQVANVATNVVAGALTTTALPIEIRINDPETGSTLKTLYIPDARINVPSVSGRANNYVQAPFPFDSDAGVMYVYRGRR